MFYKRLKLAYSIYNFFHKKELEHNIPVYKKLGLKKKYYSPVSSKDFSHLNSQNDIQSIIQLDQTELYKKGTPVTQKSFDDFNKNGFAVIEGFLDHQTVNEVNAQIDTLLKEGKTGFSYINKIMFAIGKSKLLRDIGTNKQLTEVLSNILNGTPKLFQSINFLTGSQQKTHSDSIHMTTYPLGGLLGVWIALEDIDEDQGPLHYYPGSHTLPYYLNSNYDNEGNSFLIGDKDYVEYEKMLEKKIQELKLEKQIFKAKKGDLLIWHANLLHGGEPHKSKDKTRKSMVFHYFKENCICYHEITQRPALMKQY